MKHEDNVAWHRVSLLEDSLGAALGYGTAIAPAYTGDISKF